ncbi:MAG: hypothetical protein IJW71_03050 [Clostridia bacterium]|nr:hypothetical protein [Clostridia bacterium]
MAEVIESTTLRAEEKNAFCREFEFSLASARARGCRAIKLRFSLNMKNELQKALRRCQKEGRILCSVLGEKIASGDGSTQYLLNKLPELEADADFMQRVDGVVFLYL